jgi:hypothetical protein
MTAAVEPKEAEKQIKLDLNAQYFWAINERSDIGVPAVELDMMSGKYVVLIWTSKESALKYCYIKNPSAAKNIYQLPRRSRRDASNNVEVIQVGLLKIARRIMMAKLQEISHFVIDHPGTAGGRAMYLSVEDMAYLGRKPVPKDIKTAKDLRNFLDSVEEDD